MTCPHLGFNIISKAHGSSIIASAAYNARHKIYDEVEHVMKYPHTKSDDHVLTRILLPDGAPHEYNDITKMWNDLNRIESDRVGYRLIIPFQKELSFDDNLKLAIELLDTEFVCKGHPVQIDVHHGKNNNDHLHAIVADRRLDNGQWDTKKSDTRYYLKGTVQYDAKGRITNPDTAKVLTEKDKILSPKLKRKKLQYTPNDELIVEPGWKKLQLDANGKPVLDSNGYPVLIDIREPDYDPATHKQKFSHNGKYKKPQWKKSTKKHSDITDIGNIVRIRKTWERLQNEAFKANNITDTNGNILSVDLRSYKEQNKERPADEQLIPTLHEYRGKAKEFISEYNGNVKKCRSINADIRHAKQQQAVCTKRLAKARLALEENNNNEIKFMRQLNLRDSFIDSYAKSYDDMVRRRRAIEDTFLRQMDIHLDANKHEDFNTDRNTKRNLEKKTWLGRHNLLMRKYKSKLLKFQTESWNIRPSAAALFDSFANDKIVSFVNKQFGKRTGNIVARTLAQMRPDKETPTVGTDNRPVFVPNRDTNDALLRKASKIITSNPDIDNATQQALNNWKDKPCEAPPANALKILDAFYTAEAFYPSVLTNKPWTPEIFDSETSDNINAQYQQSLDNIAAEEQAEQKPKKQSAVITREQHQAEYERLSDIRDDTLEEGINIANGYSDIDIRTIVNKKGEPYRAKQIKYIDNMIASNKLPPVVQERLENIMQRRAKEAAEAKQYYDTYLKPASNDISTSSNADGKQAVTLINHAPLTTTASINPERPRTHS